MRIFVLALVQLRVLIADDHVIVGNRNMILNENVYAHVRETIREKVSQNSQAMAWLETIDILPEPCATFPTCIAGC